MKGLHKRGGPSAEGGQGSGRAARSVDAPRAAQPSRKCASRGGPRRAGRCNPVGAPLTGPPHPRICPRGGWRLLCAGDKDAGPRAAVPRRQPQQGDGKCTCRNHYPLIKPTCAVACLHKDSHTDGAARARVTQLTTQCNSQLRSKAQARCIAAQRQAAHMPSGTLLSITCWAQRGAAARCQQRG